MTRERVIGTSSFSDSSAAVKTPRSAPLRYLRKATNKWLPTPSLSLAVLLVIKDQDDRQQRWHKTR